MNIEDTVGEDVVTKPSVQYPNGMNAHQTNEDFVGKDVGTKHIVQDSNGMNTNSPSGMNIEDTVGEDVVTKPNVQYPNGMNAHQTCRTCFAFNSKKIKPKLLLTNLIEWKVDPLYLCGFSEAAMEAIRSFKPNIMDIFFFPNLINS